MVKSLIIILIFIGILTSVEGTFFLLAKESKCFSFEQPRDTPILFKTKNIDGNGDVGFNLYYGVEQNKELQIMNKIVKSNNEVFEYTTDNDGSYLFCFKNLAYEDQNFIKLDLDVIYGYSNEHYEKLVSEHDYDKVNIQIHKLNDLLSLTLNEADYQKHKEVEYHKETEKMNNAAVWWPIFQLLESIKYAT